MAKNINDRILQLQVDLGKVSNEIGKLQGEGKGATEIFEKLRQKFEEIWKESGKIADAADKAFSEKNPKKFNEVLGELVKVINKAQVQYNKMSNAANKANSEYERGFKQLMAEEQRLKQLLEDIALRNIQLSQKTNAEKLQDVVKYYDTVQKEYKEDTEEYLKYEKKKLDAEIKLRNQLDSDRVKKRKAQVEQAVKAETDERKRRESIQKRWDDRRIAREKQESDKRKRIEDVEIQNSISKFKLEAAKHKEAEQQKTATERKEAAERAAKEKQGSFRGGFGAQFTPRAIGGALGSLTKYLGLYQAINAAQRVFRELTLGSVREAIAFEKALANLGAVAGATSEEVSMLGKNALSVAGATKFTAEEIVGLQTELSKLGFSSEDVVASTEAIAFAAQALGSPLDATASLVGKLRNQFGLLVEETTMISDILVTSINESALSFDGFGTAMQYVGPIAKNLGLSLEQTAGAMAVLADNGFTASRIGTGLRGIFTELGKTSADVEKSLKSLAEENISLSEAVDLVGKRNAAQLITLLKNIDAIDEANDKYYQQGRALISAAKQADTFSGQMDILTSNFREFQINLGNAVIDSNIFIKVLGFLSDKAEQTALGFKFLREVGLQDFQKDVMESIDGGIDPLTVSLDRMIESGKITTDNLERVKRAFEGAAEESERLGISIQPSAEALEELGISPEQFSMLEGYFDLLQDGIEKQREQTAITKGQTQATSDYGTEVEALIDSSLKGNDVNAEAGILFKNLGANISSYEAKLKSANGITEEQRIEYEAAINVLKGYQEQVTNTILSEEELARRRKNEKDASIKAEKENIKERIKLLNDETAQLIADINERAKQQTAVAESTQERAAIEAERQLAVSNAYKETAKSIAGLKPVHEENNYLVEEAVKKNTKLSEVLGSDVIEDLNKAFKGYSSELSNLKDALDDGIIDQENYERAVAALRQRLIDTIKTFKVFASTEEVEQFADDLIAKFDVLTYEVEKNKKEVEEGKKSWEDFKEELKDDLWAKFAIDAVGALGESLSEFNDTALENTKNRLDQELDAIRSRYDIEEQILKSQLDNQLITESQYRLKQTELRKAQIAEENTINRQIFEAEKKQDRNSAVLEGVEAAAQSYIEAFKNYEPATAVVVGSIGAAIAAAQSAAQVSAINQRQFFPKKFAEGGVVSGPSHEQGGVPFTVQGKGGYEMEGGEYIINKRATAMHKDLLDRINNSGRLNPSIGRMKFADGGIVPSAANESVDYLKAIAEATTSTAIGVSKPVRAYVSDKDLRGNATERRIRDRNDRL